MNWKKLIRSKTFWTGVSSVATGVVLIVNGKTDTGIEMIVGGFAVIFVRNAIK